MKKLVLLLAVAAAACYGLARDETPAPARPDAVAPAAARSGDPIARAFENRRSDVQVAGQGTVIKILPDDADGSRHQRFIIRLASGQTVLMAHNIDLAPRIAALEEGDTVAFNGVYEWNAKGGIIHWTHRDPAGSHEAGWIRHKGQTYQ
jgi:hypothetical protein